MIDQAREARLRIQQARLMQLAEHSDLIAVEAVDVLPGWPAEKYIATYTCRGIARINSNREPEYSDLHRLEIYLTADYPNEEPRLKFLTPIWHPNVSAMEPRKVCTNQSENWWLSKDLDELVTNIGELVQYKRYHAKWEDPFPLDRAVATWVLEYAEPNHILSKTKPVDARPLLRPYRIFRSDQPMPQSQIETHHHNAMNEQKRILLGALPRDNKRITLGISNR